MKILREFVRQAGGPEAAGVVAMSAALTDQQAQDQKYRDAFATGLCQNRRASIHADWCDAGSD